MSQNDKTPTGTQPGGASNASRFAADTRNYSTNNIIDAFKKAMLEHIGVAPDVIEADGKAHRFSTNGKKDDKAGRYILHIDNGIPAGYFECHRQGIKRTWRAGRDLLPELTAEERQKIREQAELSKASKQRQETRKQAETADKTVNIWRFAKGAPFDYPYLIKKGIKPNNARIYGAALIIPMYDVTGRLWNLQRIFSDGSKRFLPGGRKRGLFTVLGGVKLATAARALVVEGWATGCTVSAIEPGVPVIVAFDAGNLAPVVGAVLGKYPDLQITIVADDDKSTNSQSRDNGGAMFNKNNAPRTGGKRVIYQNASLYSATYHEGITGFQAAIAAAGLGKTDIKPDGTIHRFRVDSDKAGTLNGWYVYFPVPVPAGAFGSWKTGQSEKWCIKAENELSHTERKELERQLEDARQSRKKEQQAAWGRAADKALLRWGAAKPLEGISSQDYLTHKREHAHGLKLEGRGVLLVPLRDVGGRLWSLQTIQPDGTKRFFGGGRVSGCFHTIGTIDPAGLLFVCEGYATGATIHRLHGAAVACAMFADNLLPVALAIRARYPKADMVIAGDNDRFTDGNPGATKAEAAARAVGGRWVIPEFPPECTSGTDFNDLAIWEASQ